MIKTDSLERSLLQQTSMILQVFTSCISHCCKIFDIFVYILNEKHSGTSEKNIIWSHSPQQTISLSV